MPDPVTPIAKTIQKRRGAVSFITVELPTKDWKAVSGVYGSFPDVPWAKRSSHTQGKTPFYRIQIHLDHPLRYIPDFFRAQPRDIGLHQDMGEVYLEVHHREHTNPHRSPYEGHGMLHLNYMTNSRVPIAWSPFTTFREGTDLASVKIGVEMAPGLTVRPLLSAAEKAMLYRLDYVIQIRPEPRMRFGVSFTEPAFKDCAPNDPVVGVRREDVSGQVWEWRGAFWHLVSVIR